MITVTPNAAEKLKILIVEQNKDASIPETAGLRLFVQGGGCSGFQYGLMIEKEPNETDEKFESNGIRIFVDPISIQYLKDAEVEFIENTTGGGFAVKNPQAKSTCGCGQSFSVE